MKNRVLIFLMLVAACSLNALRVEAQKAGNKLVYSVATDGYVNVRQAPSARSEVIGVLATGRKGAVLKSSKGTWWKVSVDNVTGYVNSKYVQLGTKPVVVKNLPEFHYEVVATCKTMKEVKDFFYYCPDALDGSPVYRIPPADRLRYPDPPELYRQFYTYIPLLIKPELRRFPFFAAACMSSFPFPPVN